MLQFDEKGYLQPAEIVELDLFEFEYHFVQKFPNSTTRRRIFNAYIHYLKHFQQNITENFFQWLDGSFVHQKENPNDLDFVIFIDYRVFNPNEAFIRNNFTLFSIYEYYDDLLDAYAVKNYPEKHPKRHETLEDISYWRDTFGSSINREPRGFVQINFDYLTLQNY